MLYIKDWFLQKNLTDSQRQLFADGEKEQIGETEKAVKIKVKADNGEFTFWCPKSCLADKPEIAAPEQMAEFKKNGVEMIAEIENRHDTDIMDFINLDDEVKAEYMGDWKEKDVQGWEYLLNRASTIREAYIIMREELHLGEFLPEIDQ